MVAQNILRIILLKEPSLLNKCMLKFYFSPSLIKNLALLYNKQASDVTVTAAIPYHSISVIVNCSF